MKIGLDRITDPHTYRPFVALGRAGRFRIIKVAFPQFFEAVHAQMDHPRIVKEREGYDGKHMYYVQLPGDDFKFNFVDDAGRNWVTVDTFGSVANAKKYAKSHEETQYIG